jgi:hypothetical protein
LPIFLTVAYFYVQSETIKVIGGSGDRLTLKVSWSRISRYPLDEARSATLTEIDRSDTILQE